MWLTFRSGGDEGETVEVTGDRFVVGRDDSASLVIHDDKVSRQHAAFRAYADGRAELADLGSANGTLVNGHLIRGPVLLQGNEQVQLGDTVLVTSTQRPSDKTTTMGVVPADIGGRPGPSPSTIERTKLRRASRRAQIIGVAAIAAVVAVAVLFATGVFTGGDEGGDRPGGQVVEDVADRLRPSTLQIRTLVNGDLAGTGTGWVLDAQQGLIVTNGHVINGGTEYRVRLASNDEVRDATLVASAPCEDLAVLRVANTAGLLTVPLGDQDQVRLGQRVIVLGFPGSATEGGSYTVTVGAVSTNGTRFDTNGVNVPRYSNVIQTDAAINPGNSGGPMVNEAGQLIGVNSASATLRNGRIIQGQGYAIGVRKVREITDILRTGRSVGFAGFGFGYPADAQELTQLGLPDQNGLIIESALPGSPAANAGFGRAPVLLTQVNGMSMDGTLPGYCDAVAQTRAGQPIALTFVQQNATASQELSINLSQ